MAMCGNTQNLAHPHHLAWVHREVIEAAYNKEGKEPVNVFEEGCYCCSSHTDGVLLIVHAVAHFMLKPQEL